MGSFAPEPASRYKNLNPKYSPAKAVAAAISGFVRGIGKLPLMYWAVVVTSDSISM